MFVPARVPVMAMVARIHGNQVGEVIVVNDRMQSSYHYVLSAAPEANFAPEFRPVFSPKEMLGLGVFESKYCNDCRPELPDWFENARIAARPDAALNCFGVKSRQPLRVWRQKGWIIGPDPRGWFMVLPLPPGPPAAGGRPDPDPPLAQFRPPRGTSSQELHAWRHLLPATAASGAIAIGP